MKSVFNHKQSYQGFTPSSDWTRNLIDVSSIISVLVGEVLLLFYTSLSFAEFPRDKIHDHNCSAPPQL